MPFWLMRQAGRYLPEYRELRAKAGSFLDLCFNPEWATEVTLQPLRRFDMDAAILFSDILVVPYALGQNLTFVEGEGPKLGTLPDLHVVDWAAFDAKLAPVYETVKRVRAALPPHKTLIGFAGAPWTIACYMIEGGAGGGEFIKAKTHAFSAPEKFDALIGTLVEATAHYLIAQVKAGADAVQIFDSWAGLLPDAQFTRWVVKPTQRIVELLRKAGVTAPIIGFPRRAGAFYAGYAAATGVDGVGLDQYQPIASLGRAALQGNLDPVALLTGGRALEEEATRILNAARGLPFIFNLGHGVIKETPPAHVAQLSAIIKAHGA